jgi:hypothetical protein
MDLDADNIMDVDEKVDRNQPNQSESTNRHDLLSMTEQNELPDDTLESNEGRGSNPLPSSKSLSLIDKDFSDKKKDPPPAQLGMVDLKKKPEVPPPKLSDNPFIASD